MIGVDKQLLRTIYHGPHSHLVSQAFWLTGPGLQRRWVRVQADLRTDDTGGNIVLWSSRREPCVPPAADALAADLIHRTLPRWPAPDHPLDPPDGATPAAHGVRLGWRYSRDDRGETWRLGPLTATRPYRWILIGWALVDFPPATAEPCRWADLTPAQRQAFRLWVPEAIAALADARIPVEDGHGQTGA